MTFDQSTLYNKFHILSVGLRRIEYLIYDKSKIGYKIDTFIVGDEVYDTLKKLITESDKGMEYIKETDLGWIGG